MRILHVMPHYYPAVRYGGPIRSVQGLAAATAAMGHDVHVYTTNVDGPGLCDRPIGQSVALDGVKVTYFPAGLGRKAFRSPAMGRALDDTIASFDIVHIHYIWVWTTVRAAAAARRSCTPYVLAPRGMLVADLIRRQSRIPKLAWLALFGRRDVEGAAVLHMTSEVEAADFKALDIPARRIAIIPNGVEIPELTFGDPSVRAAGRPYVLFLGRISWKKGLDRLVEAFASVEDADLVVAGYDENGYQAAVERLADEAGVRGRTRFVGPAEGDAKSALIRNATCLVLPSYNENFGMSAIEAMALSRPVVVTKEVGLSSIVAASGAGLAIAGDPAEFSQALNFMIRNPDKARAMGEAGRRTVEERFGWPAVAGQVVSLYRACTDGPA